MVKAERKTDEGGSKELAGPSKQSISSVNYTAEAMFLPGVLSQAQITQCQL